MFLLKLVSFFAGGILRFGLFCYLSITFAEASGGAPLQYMNQIKGLTVGQVVEVVEAQIVEVSEVLVNNTRLNEEARNS